MVRKRGGEKKTVLLEDEGSTDHRGLDRQWVGGFRAHLLDQELGLLLILGQDVIILQKTRKEVRFKVRRHLCPRFIPVVNMVVVH